MTDLPYALLLILAAIGFCSIDLPRKRRPRPMAEAVRLNPGLARKGW